jgi:hypothetical protein
MRRPRCIPCIAVDNGWCQGPGGRDHRTSAHVSPLQYRSSSRQCGVIASSADNTRPHAPSFRHLPALCPSQHESCPRFSPPLPPLPTFNQFSISPWRHMRRRRNAIFSHIPLPPGCSPATPQPPSYPSFKTSSNNSIAVAAAIRDHQVGSTQQSTSSTHSLLHAWSKCWSR